MVIVRIRFWGYDIFDEIFVNVDNAEKFKQIVENGLFKEALRRALEKARKKNTFVTRKEILDELSSILTEKGYELVKIVEFDYNMSGIIESEDDISQSLNIPKKLLKKVIKHNKKVYVDIFGRT